MHKAQSDCARPLKHMSLLSNKACTSDKLSQHANNHGKQGICTRCRCWVNGKVRRSPEARDQHVAQTPAPAEPPTLHIIIIIIIVLLH
jgi:hypothetical protein